MQVFRGHWEQNLRFEDMHQGEKANRRQEMMCQNDAGYKS